MSYQTPRNTRRESRTLVGRFRGGKLAPMIAVPVRGNEGGMLSQTVTFELDPIGGRMISAMYGEVISVFVPVQAIDAIKDPSSAYAGMTDVIREKLLTGNPLFGLETEGEISKRCGVNPRSVGGVKKVNEIVRLAHNAAVNNLRLRKYAKATQLLHTNTAITPALISQTVLERLNGVLDPDDRVNGAVSLELPTLSLPVSGIGFVNTGATVANQLVKETNGTTNVTYATASGFCSVSALSAKLDNATNKAPQIFAALNGVSAGNVSLVDFYNAQNMDKLTRTMDQMITDNPEYGEEMVLRWAHGLSVETGATPFVIYEQRQQFGRNIVGAMDTAGINAETMRSDMALSMTFSVPIPRTELGGIIITFGSLKPDETLASQPHPILSDVWGVDNFVAAELALDPVPVTIRELDSDCLQAQESTISMYTGYNALKALYVHYGLNRHLDKTTVANKTAIWQLEVPMSVTPSSVLYPDTLSHYPFADQNAEVCTYVISSQAVIPTPMIMGPSPVETVSVIDTQTLFT
jgi:hypothetical protein